MSKDIEQLQGVWNIVSLEMDGRTLSAAALGGAKIAIQENRFTSTGMGSTYEGTIEVDSSATPKTFNLNFASGPEKGNVNLGIYELVQDSWRICLSTRGATRPRKFAAESGTGMAVEVLQRGTESNPETFNFNMHLVSDPHLSGEWSMVSGSFDGHPMDKNFVRVGKRIVNGNEMQVTFGKDVYSKAKYTVDRSVTPASIDFYNTHGGNAGKLQYGIYELNGKTLKLSIAAPGQLRPSDFTSVLGDGRTVVVWTLP